MYRSNKRRSQWKKMEDNFKISRAIPLLIHNSPILQNLPISFPMAPFSRSTAAKPRWARLPIWPICLTISTQAYTYEAFFASDGRSKNKPFGLELCKPK